MDKLWDNASPFYARSVFPILFATIPDNEGSEPRDDRAEAHLRQSARLFGQFRATDDRDCGWISLFYGMENLVLHAAMIAGGVSRETRLLHGMHMRPPTHVRWDSSESSADPDCPRSVLELLLTKLLAGEVLTRTRRVRSIPVSSLVQHIVVGHKLLEIMPPKQGAEMRYIEVDVQGKRGEIRMTPAERHLKDLGKPGPVDIRTQIADTFPKELGVRPAGDTLLFVKPPDMDNGVWLKGIRQSLWAVATNHAKAPRKYYVGIRVENGVIKRPQLPQLVAIYVLAFYLSNISRYFCWHFDALRRSYGPFLQEFAESASGQFLYLMGSEIIGRPIALPDDVL